jgi:deoxyribodipyrimidine photo-lyase
MDLIQRLSMDPRTASHNSGTADPDGRYVVYWMRRAQRAFDNPALEAAISIANQLKLPAAASFLLRPHRHYANLRQFAFMIEGLADTVARLERRKIGFIPRPADVPAADEFGRLCNELRPAVIVTDRNPPTPPNGWQKLIPLAVKVPAFSLMPM